MQVINYEIAEDPEDNIVPESLKRVFASKHIDEPATSLLNKVQNSKSLDLAADSATVEEQAIAKANALLDKHSIFSKGGVHAKIGPLNNIKLKEKERREQREATAGRKWGEMPKVEMTEELKADLRALQLRNFIYPNRFYKTNDSKKLP